eukprot:1465613-Pleurochrysis_carterae.AAC.3
MECASCTDRWAEDRDVKEVERDGGLAVEAQEGRVAAVRPAEGACAWPDFDLWRASRSAAKARNSDSMLAKGQAAWCQLGEQHEVRGLDVRGDGAVEVAPP